MTRALHEAQMTTLYVLNCPTGMWTCNVGKKHVKVYLYMFLEQSITILLALPINGDSQVVHAHIPWQGFIQQQKFGGKVQQVSGRMYDVKSLGRLWDVFFSGNILMPPDCILNIYST